MVLFGGLQDSLSHGLGERDTVSVPLSGRVQIFRATITASTTLPIGGGVWPAETSMVISNLSWLAAVRKIRLGSFMAETPAFSLETDTQAEITGPTGSGFSEAILMEDLDGDGLDDLIVGAPDSSNEMGSVYAGILTSDSMNELDAGLHLSGPAALGAARRVRSWQVGMWMEMAMWIF